MLIYIYICRLFQAIFFNSFTILYGALTKLWDAPLCKGYNIEFDVYMIVTSKFNLIKKLKKLKKLHFSLKFYLREKFDYFCNFFLIKITL